MEREVHGVTLELVQGDISSQDDVEAVVQLPNGRSLNQTRVITQNYP